MKSRRSSDRSPRATRVMRAIVEARVPLHVTEAEFLASLPGLPDHPVTIVGRDLGVVAARLRYRRWGWVTRRLTEILHVADRLTRQGDASSAATLRAASRAVRGI